MANKIDQISEVKIKQIFLLLLIIVLAALICFNLAMFIPSILGAITLYIITRKYNLYLQEEKKWKSWMASLVIIVGTLIVLILPIYLIGDLLVEKLGNANAYMAKFNAFIDKIHPVFSDKKKKKKKSKENIQRNLKKNRK